jgi:hypothetical protein
MASSLLQQMTGLLCDVQIIFIITLSHVTVANSDSDQLFIWYTQQTERYIVWVSVHIQRIRDIQQWVHNKLRSRSLEA